MTLTPADRETSPSDEAFGRQRQPRPGSQASSLRRLRVERGLSQRQLSEIAGIGLRTLRRLENETAYRPDLSTVSLVATSLGVSLVEVVGHTAEPAMAPRSADLVVDGLGPQALALISALRELAAADTALSEQLAGTLRRRVQAVATELRLPGLRHSRRINARSP